MKCRVSVIVPNRNGAKTIGLCLKALFESAHDSFEVVVVDDFSTDNSVEIIKQFPCTLVRLERHCGAAAARNRGAQNSNGAVLFFTDADCLVNRDTLSIVDKAAAKWDHSVVVGGTYTCTPYDQSFFSIFQSVFIHYCELKNTLHPDYIAAHAMVISTDVFRSSKGFPENFQPIIEDVEYSHRLRRQGYRLVMDPEIQVQHIFNYSSLADSMRNGFYKSKFWTMYSLGNKDLLSDSGTASLGLKINTLSFYLVLALSAVSFIIPSSVSLFGIIFAVSLNMYVNRQLFRLFNKTSGLYFMIRAIMYYMMVYPLAVGTGALTGMVAFLFPLRSEGMPQS